MAETDNIIVDTTEKILSDLCDPQTVNNAKDDSWKQPLWQALEENGLTKTWVPESAGGVGASMTDGFEVLRIAGQFAIPVPLAETLLAGWLLAEAGLAVPDGMLTVAPVNQGDAFTLGSDGTISGSAHGVPFARDAAQIVLLAQKGDGAAVALVNRDDCAIHQRQNHAGDAQDSISLDGVQPAECADSPRTQDDLMRIGAAIRCAEMGGALQRILDISVEYAKEREAFGRTISKFQAVQHNLAQLAGETAAAVAAASSAADTIENGEAFGEAGFLEIASAKIRVGEAAGKGAAIGHQAHGAIGYTMEHVLHRFTQRLWTWRDDFGSESEWAVRLGEVAAAKGAEELWSMLAAR
jgi:acyl-CoA dehydrogenase